MNIYDKIEKMSDNDLLIVWNGLFHESWNCDTMYDDEFSMDDWAQGIYSELNNREIEYRT
jgi:hypothetical protein